MLTFCFTRQDNITGDNFVHWISNNFQAGLKTTLSLKQIMLNSIFYTFYVLYVAHWENNVVYKLCLFVVIQCHIQILFICCHMFFFSMIRKRKHGFISTFIKT